MADGASKSDTSGFSNLKSQEDAFEQAESELNAALQNVPELLSKAEIEKT